MPVAVVNNERNGKRRNQVSPSEFFPSRIEHQSKSKRLRLAMKNWLNGLPVHEEEDVLHGVGSEQAITRPPASPRVIERKRKRDIFKLKRFRRKIEKVEVKPEIAEIFIHNEESTVELKKDNDKIDRAPIRLIQIPPPIHHHHLPWQTALPEGFEKRDDLAPYSVSNRIKTAKYSLLTFLPKNLFEQFRRVANVYFLFIVILQAIPVISNYNVGLASLPLLVIVTITAIKDGFEDYKRYKQDQRVNYAITKTLKRHENVVIDVKPTWTTNLKMLFKKNEPILPDVEKLEWQPCFWQNVRVGDIVYLQNNEMIPADVLILSTSEPDGVCYVETKNLDGETNLKVKRGPTETAWIQTADDAVTLKGQLEVELPSSNLYSFLGRLVLDENYNTGCADKSDKLEKEENSFVELENGNVIPVDANALLLRGCVLRNTSHVIGLVVYTGPHTKLILNAGGTPSKRSRIERQMNPQIILNFVLLFVICLVCAIVQGALASGVMSKAPYWVSSFSDSGSYSSSFAGFLTFWSSVILFQTLVPISLYLTVELCKTAQAFLIHSDEDLYDVASDSVCVPRAWNLSDDLGQIEFLFSDKTGTLTRNIMEFRRISIGGKTYGFLPTSDENVDISKGNVNEEILADYEAQMTDLLSNTLPYNYIPPSKHAFIDPNLIHDLLYDDQMRPKIKEFFILLSVCHTVLVDEKNPDCFSPSASLSTVGSGKEIYPHRLIFKAQSPDEAALVATSRDLGFVFLGRQQAELTISVMGEIEKLTVLNVLEFNSTRKRMSIIVRRADGSIMLYTKGADSIIYNRLLEEEANSPLGKITLEHLDLFAEDGLRTLCLAGRQLSPSEYNLWSKSYMTAASALHDRDLLVEAACDELEKGLYLLGASAIEDRLADGVPECIERLQLAGIKIWVLTGDKLETAINIGFACRLLSRDMLLLTVRNADASSTHEQLRSAYEQIWRQHFAFDASRQPCALIIEGGSLKHALSTQSRRLFLELASKCKAVICCRVSPLQKAQVVQLVRRGKHSMTLAIGDGANDVSMLQAADIGVGIAGQEGMQAVMSSDYALAQFKHLGKLLLVHGRWSYIRTAEVTLQSFYKNILFVVLLFWFQFDCGFTAEYVYDYMYLMFFNLLFSVVPLLVLGTFDRDLEAPILRDVPPIYKSGIRQCAYNMKLFGLYLLDAAYQSLICFFVPRAVFGDAILGNDGLTESKALLGNVMALSVIASCNLYMILNTLSWTWLTFASIPISILVPVSFLGLYSLLPSQELYGSALILFEQPVFWAVLLVTVMLSLAPRVLVKYIQREVAPTDLDISRELVKYGKVEGEETLRKTIDSLFADREGPANNQIEAIPTAPPRLAHRDTSKELTNTLSAEELDIARPALARTPSSFFAESLRRRLVPLGTARSSRLRVFNLRTGRFEKITGFAYSQDEGMRRLIEGTAVPAFGSNCNTNDGQGPTLIRAPPSAAKL